MMHIGYAYSVCHMEMKFRFEAVYKNILKAGSNVFLGAMTNGIRNVR